MQKRFENATVEVEIDADGWPKVTIFPETGNPQVLVVRPNGHAQFIESVPDTNPLFSRD